MNFWLIDCIWTDCLCHKIRKLLAYRYWIVSSEVWCNKYYVKDKSNALQFSIYKNKNKWISGHLLSTPNIVFYGNLNQFVPVNLIDLLWYVYEKHLNYYLLYWKRVGKRNRVDRWTEPSA